MGKAIILLLVGLLFVTGCNQKLDIVKEYPISSNDIIDDSLAVFKDESVDNNGCLLIKSDKETRVRLYETSDIDLENCFFVYQADLKSSNFEGVGFLEMLCTINGAEYFSKGLDNTISGTKDWEKHTTVFRFRMGEKPKKIKLNLIMEGKGEIEIDNIRLMKRDLTKFEM